MNTPTIIHCKQVYADKEVIAATDGIAFVSIEFRKEATAKLIIEHCPCGYRQVICCVRILLALPNRLTRKCQ